MNRSLLVLVAVLFLSACGERIEPGLTAGEPAVVSGLVTAVVESLAAAESQVLPGSIESADRGQLTSRLPGQVARILVNKGQQVQSGESLLVLSGETASGELKAAEAAVTAAERRLAEAGAYQKLAEATYARFAALRAARAVTPHEFDQAEADRDTAVERLGAAEAALAVSRAQREAAQVMADQATVKAPYAATVAEILVDNGSTVLPGTPLLALDRSGHWQVRVALPERLAARHRIGDGFRVVIPALDKELPGRLAELQPSADVGSRTFTAWLTLPEDAALQSGLFARVLAAEGPAVTAVKVPTAAVVTRGQLTGVYVIEENLLHYRLVRTGAEHDGLVEILSGLRADEEIVVGEVERARHGARLERSR